MYARDFHIEDPSGSDQVPYACSSMALNQEDGADTLNLPDHAPEKTETGSQHLLSVEGAKLMQDQLSTPVHKVLHIALQETHRTETQMQPLSYAR